MTQWDLGLNADISDDLVKKVKKVPGWDLGSDCTWVFTAVQELL